MKNLITLLLLLCAAPVLAGGMRGQVINGMAITYNISTGGETHPTYYLYWRAHPAGSTGQEGTTWNMVGAISVGNPAASGASTYYPSAAGYAGSFSPPNVCYVEIWRGQKGSGGVGVVTNVWNVTTNIVVQWYHTAPAASSNWFCGSVKVRNLDAVAHYYGGRTNGVILDIQSVPAGGEYSFTFCATNYFTVDAVKLNSDFAPDGNPITGNYTTNTTPATPSPVGDPGNGSGAQYAGGTSNILWGTNVPNVGDSALYDAMVKLGQQAHDDAVAIQLAMGSNGGTTLDLTGVEEKLEQIRTNTAPREVTTNAYNLSGTASNITSATQVRAAVGEVTDVDTGIETLKGTLAGPGTISTPGASPTTIQLGAHAMIIDPMADARWSVVWTFALNFFTWVLIASFLTKVVVDAMTFLHAIASGQTTKVPNMIFGVSAAGFGTIGNYLGVALVIGIIVASLVVYAACLAVWIASFAEWSTWAAAFARSPVSTAGLGGAVSTGVNWLMHIFPVDLAVSLVTAYILFRLTMTKAVWVVVTIMRVFIG